MPCKQTDIPPSRRGARDLGRHKTIRLKSGAPTMHDGLTRSTPHPLSLHKTATVDDGTGLAPAAPINLDVAGAPSRPGCGGLDRAYTAFCVTVGVLKLEFGTVPTEAGARAEFIEELVTEAWYCLAEQVDAANEHQYALIGPVVPDLIFARLDHVTPVAFAANLDAQTLAKWHGIRNLLVDRTMTPVMMASEMADIVMRRILAEAHLHRPIAEIFAKTSDAH